MQIKDWNLDQVEHDLGNLPGAEIIFPGIRDLEQGRLTENALLTRSFTSRLRRLGFQIPDCGDVAVPFHHQLYSLLEDTHGASAYSRYKSQNRRVISFAQACESLD